jgi:biotin-(acetyl-CoA carboxylase) ligase
LAVELLTRLDLLAAKLDAGDWETVVAAWLERAPLARGATVSVLAANGKAWSGVTAGLATDGALRVTDATGTVREVRQVESVRYREGL